MAECIGYGSFEEFISHSTPAVYFIYKLWRCSLGIHIVFDLFYDFSTSFVFLSFVLFSVLLFVFICLFFGLFFGVIG